MLIMSVEELVAAVGAKCGGNSPDANDERMTIILNLILPRIEDAMNVQSLVRGNFTDTFLLPNRTNRSNPDERIKLRLTNGFIVPNSMVITDQTGAVVTSDTTGADNDMGLAFLKSWNRGTYVVAYSSGFQPEPVPDNPPDGYDPNSRVLQGVPDWIKGIAVDFVVRWFRTQQLAVKVPQSVAYSALEQALRADVYARVYMRYMRPRVGVIWSDGFTHE